MRYLRVDWIHSFLDEPVGLYSELDDQSMEVRKVEIFRDGTLGFADVSEDSGSTRLGLEPVPSLDTIALDPQFLPTEINQAEFDQIWEAAYAVCRAK